MMKRGIIQYSKSCAGALALVAVLYRLSSSPAGVLLVPGMVLAAVAFPQGGHSNHGLTYVYLAMLINVLFYGGLVMLIYRGIVWLRAGR
jgi:hypothetical protein